MDSYHVKSQHEKVDFKVTLKNGQVSLPCYGRFKRKSKGLRPL